MPKIDCKFLKQTTNTIVNSTGQVWPCCYFGVHEHKSIEQEQPIFKEYQKNKDKYNLNNHTLKEILNSEWFTKTLPDSWKDDKMTARQCKRWCTEGHDPAQLRIKIDE